MRTPYDVIACHALRGFVLTLLLGLAAPAAWAAWPHDALTHPALRTTVSGQHIGFVGVPDGAGGAYFSWEETRSGDHDIFLQRITADGTIAPGWPAEGIGVCTAPSSQSEHRMIADGTGGVILAWTDRRDFAQYDIYAQRILGDGSIAPGAWAANGVSISTFSLDERFPTICSDGAGGAFVVFEVRLNGSDYDIYRARILADGTRVGPSALYVPVDLSQYPWAVSDGAGGCVTVFTSNLAGNYDIIAMRFNNAGIVWPATTVCNAANTQFIPQAVSDGGGGFYFAWLDYRTAFGDVYATHVNGQGVVTPGWLTNGNPIENLSAIAQTLSTAPDGSGGLLVAWTDTRTGSTGGGFGLRMMASGARAPGWPANGQPLGPGPSQIISSMIPDGSGGMIASLIDSRNGGFRTNFYAMRLLANGTSAPHWNYGGSPVSVQDCSYYSALVPDGTGGAIVAFTGTADRAHAQRIDRFGALGNAEPVLTSVRDVPADQGGQMRIQWKASHLDSIPVYGIGEYWIWRQTPAAAAAAAVRAGARWADELYSGERLAAAGPARGGTRLFQRAASASADYAWEFVAAQPANGSLEYSRVLPTVSDSLDGSNPYTVVMVEAHDQAGNAFWQSPADSGYSVDNLPPVAPSPFTGAYENGATALHWGRNLEADFATYRLYRGTSADFVPAPGNLVAEQADTGYVDAGPAGSYYKLAAVDAHGNVSAYAVLAPSGTVDVVPALPVELMLAAPRPNPIRAGCAIPFALPREAGVRIEVFDVGGRRVAELVNEIRPAGEHVARWGGHDTSGRRVGAGLYFVVMKVEERTLRARVLVAR